MLSESPLPVAEWLLGSCRGVSKVVPNACATGLINFSCGRIFSSMVLCAGADVMCSATGGGGGNGGGAGGGGGGEDLYSLEAEITHLQRENAKVESQMLRLKTDISAMEAHLRHGEKETQIITQRSNNMNEYFESLRNNMITILEHVRLPNGPQEKMNQDNFDNYLSKLQTLCTSSTGPEGNPVYCEENQRSMYEIKSALQDCTVVPMPI